MRITKTTSKTDSTGDGRDLGFKEPTKGILPPSSKRRDVLVGLLDIAI